MRAPHITPFVRPVLVAIVFAMSTAAVAADSMRPGTQNPTASFLDQLMSPPAPLRPAEAISADTGHRALFSVSASDAASGTDWAFAWQQADIRAAQLASAGDLQQIGTTLLDQAAQGMGSAQSLTPEQRTLMQSVTGLVSGLASLPATQNQPLRFPRTDAVVAQADGNRQLGQWLMNAARYVDTVQVSAVMPVDDSFATQAPAEAITSAINSKEATRYLERNSEAVTLLAQLLGWQKTGLLPSVADLQRMASDHVGAVSNGIEHWALRNVNFSASTQAITHTETEQPMLQWQWSITTNNSQYNSNSVADNEANFSANLRRLFGMNDYY